MQLRMSILQSVAAYDTATKIGLYVLAFVAEKLLLGYSSSCLERHVQFWETEREEEEEEPAWSNRNIPSAFSRLCSC